MSLSFNVFSNTDSKQNVVILHGLFGAKRNWQGIAKRLCSQCTVFTVDLPNHGDSPQLLPFTYEAAAQCVYDFISENKLPEPVIVGHSMGGKVAMSMASQFSDHLAGIVVMDIAPISYADRHTPIFDAMLNLNLRAYSTREEVSDALSSSLPSSELRQFLLQNIELNSAKELVWKIPLHGLSESYEAIRSFPAQAPCQLPALFCRGALSDYVPSSCISEISSHFPNYSLETIEDAGHWLHAQKPNDVLASITRFLAELPA